jgi:hypothetical protein
MIYLWVKDFLPMRDNAFTNYVMYYVINYVIVTADTQRTHL